MPRTVSLNLTTHCFPVILDTLWTFTPKRHALQGRMAVLRTAFYSPLPDNLPYMVLSHHGWTTHQHCSSELSLWFPSTVGFTWCPYIRDMWAVYSYSQAKLSQKLECAWKLFSPNDANELKLQCCRHVLSGRFVCSQGGRLLLGLLTTQFLCEAHQDIARWDEMTPFHVPPSCCPLGPWVIISQRRMLRPCRAVWSQCLVAVLDL